MPVWSGLPDKKNPVEGQRGLPHPFVILTPTSVCYKGRSMYFWEGTKHKIFFLTLKPLYAYGLTLSGPPPRIFPLDSPDGPPPTVPFLCTRPVGPPHCTLPLDSPSGPPTVSILWTPLLDPPLYRPFGLTQRTRGRPYLPRFPLLGDLGSPVGFLMKIFVVVKLMMGQIAFPVSFIFMQTSTHTFLHIIIYM